LQGLFGKKNGVFPVSGKYWRKAAQSSSFIGRGLHAIEMVICGMHEALLEDIKFNCDVSDAQFWGYYSICGLLMRYRDLFRSEKGLKPWADIRREAIGSWIGQKESRWPELEQQTFRNLTIGGRTYHPFDIAEINEDLNKEGLIYGAGYGMYMKPTFFLAELRSVRHIAGLTAFTTGTERVRDLFTAPAMLQDKTVFLRLEPLMTLLLYKHSELNVRRGTALENAFAHYGLPHRQLIDVTFYQRLEEMTERYAEVLLFHEIAEASEELVEWKDILALAGDRQVEHYLRAVKDLIADTSDRGPFRKIIESRDCGALGLSVALMEGYRRALYPELKEAYADFSLHQDWTALERARREGYERFVRERAEIVNIYQTKKSAEDFLTAVKKLMQKA
jgi:hypothetical protein